MALLVDINDLLNRRKVESDRIEFKEGWNPVSVYRSICAFANDIEDNGGGYVILGIKAIDGVPVRPVVGLPLEQIDAIQRKMIDFNNLFEPYYMPRPSVEEIDGKNVLVIWVPSGINRPYSIPSAVTAKLKKPAFYIRNGSNTIEAKGTVLDELRSLATHVPFDDRGNPNIALDDLSSDLMRDFLISIGSKLKDENLSGDNMFQVLEKMNMLEGPTERRNIKNVAAMLFCNHPEKFFPKTQVEIVFFPEGREENPNSMFEMPVIHGSIPKMISDTLQYLKTMLIKQRIVKPKDDEHSVAAFNYPYQAVEEVVVNAFYHHDYREYAPVEITVEPHRLTVFNLGGSDHSISMDAIHSAKSLRSRRYRNVRLGESLKELGLSEGRAMGIPTIQRELQRNGSALATIETDEERSFFLIDLPCHKDLIENIVLDVFHDNGLQTYNQELTERQSAILYLLGAKILPNVPLNVPLNTTNLAQLLNVSWKTIQRDVDILLSLNLIKREGSRKNGYWVLVFK